MLLLLLHSFVYWTFTAMVRHERQLKACEGAWHAEVSNPVQCTIKMLRSSRAARPLCIES